MKDLMEQFKNIFEDITSTSLIKRLKQMISEYNKINKKGSPNANNNEILIDDDLCI